MILFIQTLTLIVFNESSIDKKIHVNEMLNCTLGFEWSDGRTHHIRISNKETMLSPS